jgi:murein DD-endopeptidase MepM/ murein hydrolase activator NlpD
MTRFVLSRSHLRRRRRLGRSVAASVLLVVVGTAVAPISAAGAAGSTPETGVLQRAEDVERLGQWLWPVPAPIRVVSPFRAPPTPYASGHRGIDVAARQGDVFIAPAAGVVSFAGRVVDRGVVAIDHGDGIVSAIEPVDALVAEGEVVAAGDPIGVMASGGHCADECAHFGVRIDGEYVSPFLFLGGLPRAVLLPLP